MLASYRQIGILPDAGSKPLEQHMFITVLERSLSLAQHNIGTLLRTGWAYILVLIALNFAIGAAMMPESGFTTVSYMTEPVAAVDEGALRGLAIIANLLVGFSIAIAYVRRILIDARDFPLTFETRTLRVILNQVILALIGALSLVPLAIVALIVAAMTAGVGLLLFVLAPFIALMVVQRFSVILPAAAVDDPLGLKESWRATSGLGWAMAFSALVMSLLAGFLVLVWVVTLNISDRLLPANDLWQQIHSAVLPMGTMLILTWIFASLHATFYGLIRERFARQLGLRSSDYAKADERRTAARARALKALHGAQRLNRR
ncbi:4-hydroxy-3-methylbut-2-en-1-yl diphosphate synthase [Roseibium salinum]|uniref:4-hydroxy-3-methylbut-2-en-1-yl diphosphate synthase n=1 Tax=Roseibium salinum TaxID=1604349 RepID=A0ABT3R7E5_9HYPH|nr:4-hydroxy-3-methylbut-2-en-1-yl diphosphate synthase [Roseibium sp. DSM 29163]MCX2725059.1 4-hydroxy-3-methylbut-2-en-1-yl diphosphate synthase [Roseibium sp. DSM 29163]MDN3721037.1 4-hydroxy-3-methylbut-2-en-1-yl diphosphate synthase [Roseibium salinum]